MQNKNYQKETVGHLPFPKFFNYLITKATGSQFVVLLMKRRREKNEQFF